MVTTTKQQTHPDPSTILITGASSGLGAALALHYAAPGVRLLLLGRNRERLSDIEILCRSKQAMVVTALMDVTDSTAMHQFIHQQFLLNPIDLVIANAGISGGTGGAGEASEQARRIMAVNVDGVLNTVLPVLPLMTGRGSGQIAIISSIAGLRGLPSAPAYSASKAAVRVYGDALRGYLRAQGVAVSVICPGYITTPMTDANDFPMPFIMSAQAAACKIAAALAQRQGMVAFPWPLVMAVKLLTALPARWSDAILAKLPRKV